MKSCVDVVALQHNDAIWGGEDGEWVLDFVHALDVPAVTTLHTIAAHPTPRRRAILTELIEASRTTVVMSRSAATLLATEYGVDPSRIAVIPHGVPDLPIVDPKVLKASLGLDGHAVILSLGQLGPGKGHELVLAALPAIIARNPTAMYVVVGATHPDVLRRDGETYRTALAARIEKLKLTDHVKLVDRFVGRVELTRWLESADVFVTPYPDLDQMVSGTLSYAMGAARAIVSTPYPYATELLAEGRGVVVAPDSAEAFAAGVNGLLADDVLRAETGRRAHEYSRRMIWSEVGAEYGRLFDRIVAAANGPAAAGAPARRPGDRAPGLSRTPA